MKKKIPLTRTRKRVRVRTIVLERDCNYRNAEKTADVVVARASHAPGTHRNIVSPVYPIYIYIYLDALRRGSLFVFLFFFFHSFLFLGHLTFSFTRALFVYT